MSRRTPGGFHNIFIYKHSNGRTLPLHHGERALLATSTTCRKVVNGDVEHARVARCPSPSRRMGSGGSRGYHDFYVGYHPGTGKDRFYGGGTGGYYIYDITDLQNPKLRVTLTGVSGVSYGHTFTPSPDGRYVVAETEYQYAPLRIFDLQPALDGEGTNISNPIAAFTADWTAPGAQPRGALALRVRVGLPGRAPDLQPAWTRPTRCTVA